MLHKHRGADAPEAMLDDPRDLSAEDYEQFRRLVYQMSGINLGDHKQQLVRARLGKRLRAGNFSSYRAYLEFIKQDKSGGELCNLIDAISTNTTHLFRERQHFEFLAKLLRSRYCEGDSRRRPANLRVWSAGCSSGEEPYSIVMTVDDTLSTCGAVDWKILATDISTKVLARAKQGIFEAHRVGTVPEGFRRRYLMTAPGGDSSMLQVKEELRRRITFARFNLMEDRFPFRQGFDVIFCRNVMIYFDQATQTALVQKFSAQLRPGGHLLIGHSESLNNLKHSLRYVQPTIYQRVT